MIVWVVKTTEYDGYSDHVDVHGVYSNLALAGRAAMEIVENATEFCTFIYSEESWGYHFMVIAHTYGDRWYSGEIEIIRMLVN